MIAPEVIDKSQAHIVLIDKSIHKSPLSAAETAVQPELAYA